MKTTISALRKNENEARDRLRNPMKYMLQIHTTLAGESEQENLNDRSPREIVSAFLSLLSTSSCTPLECWCNLDDCGEMKRKTLKFHGDVHK
jgi:hypothetical protein